MKNLHEYLDSEVRSPDTSPDAIPLPPVTEQNEAANITVRQLRRLRQQKAGNKNPPSTTNQVVQRRLWDIEMYMTAIRNAQTEEEQRELYTELKSRQWSEQQSAKLPQSHIWQLNESAYEEQRWQARYGGYLLKINAGTLDG